MGADNLATFHRWKDWRGIFATVPIAVFDRPRSRLPALASVSAQRYGAYRLPEARARLLADCRPPAWTFITGRLSPLSSTALRRQRAAAS